jgi:hypothetical protein
MSHPVTVISTNNNSLCAVMPISWISVMMDTFCRVSTAGARSYVTSSPRYLFLAEGGISSATLDTSVSIADQATGPRAEPLAALKRASFLAYFFC